MRLIPSNSRAVDLFHRDPDPAGILDGDPDPRELEHTTFLPTKEGLNHYYSVVSRIQLAVLIGIRIQLRFWIRILARWKSGNLDPLTSNEDAAHSF